MKKLIDRMTLYHGSYCEVRHPDLKKCAKYKDFGQGFYLTSSKEQAIRFLRTSVKKAVLNGSAPSEQNYGMVSSYQFHSDPQLNMKTFPTADADWLHCVVGHRKKDSFSELVQELRHYDIIAGKIANDKTNAAIAAYMAYAYGELGSETADRICISLLLPERLQDQFCFRTNAALKCLSFVESEKICL